METNTAHSKATHLVHYTLNSGHSHLSPRSEVPAEVIEQLQGLLYEGTHTIPVEGDRFRVRIRHYDKGMIAAVLDGERDVVLFGIAPDTDSASAVWNELVKQYDEFREEITDLGVTLPAAACPKSTPWCAAAVFIAGPDVMLWVADFERCLAWAWIEREGA